MPFERLNLPVNSARQQFTFLDSFRDQNRLPKVILRRKINEITVWEFLIFFLSPKRIIVLFFFQTFCSLR